MTVDPSTFRLAVAFLGFALLACIAGIVTLSALHDTIPDVLATLAGVVGGALAGLFVTPHSSEPTPVTVIDQPVRVTDAAPTKKTAARRRRGDGGYSTAALIVAVFIVLVAFGLGGYVHPLFLLLIIVAALLLLTGA